jgi:uncharacterized protein YkwD
VPGARQGFVAFAAALTALVFAASASARGLTASESSVLRAMNAVRVGRGLARLRLDTRLERSARGHSTDMLRRGYFSHSDFAARMAIAGARGPLFGEDLSWGPPSAQWVVEHWLASPSHRANLLRPGFRRVGVGTVIGTFGGHADALVVTADFAGH